VIGDYPGQVVRVVCTLMAPAIMLFGLYVILHGHYGPGGGFAGGIVVGVGVILLRITVERAVSYRVVPPAAARVAASVGVLAFIAIGLAPLLAGGAFLDYAAVEIPGLSDPDMRYFGILVVEVAVGVAVTGVMLVLFDHLVDATPERAGDA
jgi:multicomponent Na+:H+ antiporter subunit B